MPHADPTFKRAYAADPGLRDAVFDLLDEVFPGVGMHERAAAALGFRWTDVSTPFLRAEGDGRRLEIYFTPDRLGVAARAEPFTLRDSEEAAGGEGDTILMVRGPFPPEGKPFMLPRSARC